MRDRHRRSSRRRQNRIPGSNESGSGFERKTSVCVPRPASTSERFKCERMVGANEVQDGVILAELEALAATGTK